MSVERERRWTRPSRGARPGPGVDQARGYRYRRGEIAGVLRSLLGAQEIRVERSDLAWQALNGYEDGSAGFADFVIGLCAREEGAEWTWAFDRKAAGSELFRVIGGAGPRTGAR